MAWAKQARARAEEGLALARASVPSVRLALALRKLAAGATDQGDLGAARTALAEGLAVLRADHADPNRLDADRDGVACESNPAPRDPERVPR
jgi:hypothetical protein